MAEPEIIALDLQFLGRPQAIAAYLVRGPEGLVLVEAGPGSTLPALRAALQAQGAAPDDIRAVLLTHIHLDHAGAAGWWARQGARVYVHHLGAPHLVDPERLLASARRIYGADMDRLWGEFLSAPSEQVRALGDRDVIVAGGLTFTAHDTPGHARHHLVYQLGEAAFAGDLAGVRRTANAHLRIPTPPPEFDLEAWQGSVARMRALRLKRIYLTHFGAVDDAAAHWERVEALLPQYTERVREAVAAGQGRDEIAAELAAWEAKRLRADGVNPDDWPIYDSLGPAGMAADGLMRYWKKRVGSP
jgi:glyoxylase-like metal-dependent hydrolase (beta-lactamase superfamily II)